jgi:hypothetical protein
MSGFRHALAFSLGATLASCSAMAAGDPCFGPAGKLSAACYRQNYCEGLKALADAGTLSEVGHETLSQCWEPANYYLTFSATSDQPPPGAVVSTTMTEQQCEARPRLYEQERDHHTYYALVRKILAKQGLSPVQWWMHYQLDHLVPWGLCGADGEENEWMQPLAEAKLKDRQEHVSEMIVRRLPEMMSAAQQFYIQGRWRKTP